MKKYIFVSILIIYFAITFYSEAKNLSVPLTTRVEQAKIDDYQKSIDRAKELKLLQDPTIVQNKIRNVKKLTSLEGQYKYLSHISDKGFMNLTLREMTLDFSYNFGIGMSMEYINVYKIADGVVYVKIPKNRLQLQYIQMNPESRIIGDKKKFLVSQFKPSDIEIIIEQSQQNVVNKIGADKKLFEQAMANTQENIEWLILKMGLYESVVFEIV